MPTTYEAIATVTVGAGGASSIDFTSIPATYTDLKLALSIRSNGASEDISLISFNGNTSNFSNKYVQGNGAAASSGSIARWGGNYTASNNTANTFGNAEIYITNYAGSTAKSYSTDNVTETNGTTAYAGLTANLWNNTAAITSITLAPNTGSYVQYSTATLYGIKNS